MGVFFRTRGAEFLVQPTPATRTTAVEGASPSGQQDQPVCDVPLADLRGIHRTMYNPSMTTQELLIEEIRRQPEPVQREVLHFLRFLVRERDEQSWADVLPGREVEDEVLSILDGQGPQTR